jgi:glutamine amidotransferase-like uncharacterized protein
MDAPRNEASLTLNKTHKELYFQKEQMAKVHSVRSLLQIVQHFLTIDVVDYSSLAQNNHIATTDQILILQSASSK